MLPTSDQRQPRRQHRSDRDRSGWPKPKDRQPGAEKHLLGFNPKTEKFEYIIPMDPDHVVRNAMKWLQSIAFDSQNNVYVGWIMGGAIAKFDRATKKVTVFPIPTHNAIPYGIIADRNDNIWIALWDSGNIAKFDTHNNELTIFTPPTYPVQIRRLNVDAQNNIWFGMWSAGNRARQAGQDRSDDGPHHGVHGAAAQREPVRRARRILRATSGCADVGGSAASIFKFNPRDQSFTLYPKPQKTADTPKIQITKDGADLVFAAREPGRAGVRRALSGHGQDHEARRVLRERAAGISVQAGQSRTGRSKGAMTNASSRASKRRDAIACVSLCLCVSAARGCDRLRSRKRPKSRRCTCITCT